MTNYHLSGESEDRESSLEEMLAKIPITESRGSLLSAITNLLRIIDISESSIMIPTLLKDKCEFDAYEMLTLAKILKASILGHEDLVKYYMNEPSNLQFDLLLAKQQSAQQQHQQHHHQASLMLQSTTTSLKSSSSTTTSESTSRSTSRSASTSSSTNNRSNKSSTSSSSSSSSNHSSSNSTNNLNNSNNSHDITRQRQQSVTPSSSSALSSSLAATPPILSSLLDTTHTTANSMMNAKSSSQNLFDANNSLSQFNERAPNATINLLMQVEQLKKFIPQVTGLFESIIELYKNSVESSAPS